MIFLFIIFFYFVYIVSLKKNHLSINNINITENRFPVLLDVVVVKVRLEQRKVVKKPIKRHLHLPLPLSNLSNLYRTIKSLQVIAAM